ncbi:MAG: hypothetical protein Q9225_002293 [Loekoesia sp. 1 TL-2023]
MQNPLRRPRGDSGPRRGNPPHRDVERGGPSGGDGDILSRGMRGHLVAMSGEFVGTIMFLYFAFGATQIANNIVPPTEASLDRLLFISLAFGFSLATTAWVFYRVSGGLFNPAVTLGLVLAGGLPPVRGALLFIPQMLGGMVAAGLVSCMFPGPLSVQTKLTGGTSIAQGLFIEMFLTAELVLTVLFLAAEKSKATYLAPVAIGLALFVAELTGVYYTGGSLNPARSFGPCVANRQFDGYHYIYVRQSPEQLYPGAVRVAKHVLTLWIGPFLGAAIAAGYYHFAKWNRYEEANPGQDAISEHEAASAKSQPFRSPLLKRPTGDENDEHLSKKFKSEPVAAGPRLVFKHPGISTLPRKPLLELDKPLAEANNAPSKGFYNVLWRKMTSKKNKTWEGDALLLIDSDGMAELHDRETGRSIGRVKCDQPLLPGSTLLMSGKDVEVDSVLSKAQYVEWKQTLGVKQHKDTLPPVPKKVIKSRSALAEDKRGQGNIKVSAEPILKSKKSPKDIPNGAATGQEKRDLFGHANAKTAAHREIALLPLPRHNPHAPDALVMKRPSDADVDVVVDPLLASKLREHQKEGVKFLYECVMGLRDHNGRGAILADEMGLGKTLQTITLLWTLLKQSPNGNGSAIKKALIICPASLINNWRKEFRKWLGLDRIGVLVADTKSRLSDFTHGKSYSIMIVSYEKLRNIQAELSKGQDIDLIIADEAHRLKTAKNKSAAAIKAFPTDRRIFLTGTPVQNDLSEFYFLVNSVNPGILGSIKAFTRDLEIPINRGRQPGASSEEVQRGEECKEELMQLTSPFILRRTANVLTKFLPAKTEYVLFCRPTEPQKALYHYLAATPTFRAAALGNSESALQLITLLKKACNSPSLLNAKANKQDVLNTNSNSAHLLADIPPHLLSNNAASTKLRVLDNLLHTIRTKTPEKVVLVSLYTSTLDLLGNLLSSMGHTFSRLDGSTPTGKRQGIIDDFNRSSAEQCFAFLLSAKTGGVGINLIGASRLVLFDVDWNPATDLQAMARIHRDGQKRSCFIYRFLMAGGIDEKIWQRQIVKLGLAGIMDQKEETSSFTREDLKDLFRLDESLSCQTHDLIRCSCEGRGSDFIDIDDFADIESFSSSPVLVEVNTKDRGQQAEATKAAAHAARDALMAYTHVDTSKFADEDYKDHKALIKDDVLIETLKDEGNTVSFVFSKMST